MWVQTFTKGEEVDWIALRKGFSTELLYIKKDIGIPYSSNQGLRHWREFRPHLIPNFCSPQMIVLGELWPRTIVSVCKSHLVTVLTYELTGHTLTKQARKVNKCCSKASLIHNQDSITCLPIIQFRYIIVVLQLLKNL